MSPHKQLQEVMAEDISKIADIKCDGKFTTSWVKYITLMLKNGEDVYVRLRWDENDGYSIFSDAEIINEPELLALMERPEFEYILDSMTDSSLYNTAKES